MEQPEAKFKKHLKEAYEQLYPDGWSHYNRLQGIGGVPDLVFAVEYHTIWLEAKVVDEHDFTCYQKVNMPKMSKAGMKVVVVCLKNPDDPKKEQSIMVGKFDESKDSFMFTRVFPRKAIFEPLFWESLL